MRWIFDCRRQGVDFFMVAGSTAAQARPSGAKVTSLQGRPGGGDVTDKVTATLRYSLVIVWDLGQGEGQHVQSIRMART